MEIFKRGTWALWFYGWNADNQWLLTTGQWIRMLQWWMSTAFEASTARWRSNDTGCTCCFCRPEEVKVKLAAYCRLLKRSLVPLLDDIATCFASTDFRVFAWQPPFPLWSCHSAFKRISWWLAQCVPQIQTRLRIFALWADEYLYRYTLINVETRR